MNPSEYVTQKVGATHSELVEIIYFAVEVASKGKLPSENLLLGIGDAITELYELAEQAPVPIDGE